MRFWRPNTAIGGIALALFGGGSFASEVNPRLDAPYVAGSADAQQRLRTLMQVTALEASADAPCRMVLLSDSRLTTPGGAGQEWAHAFGYQLHERYGNTPESQFNFALSFGGGRPAGTWCLRGAYSGAGFGPAAGPVARRMFGFDSDRAAMDPAPGATLYGLVATLMHNDAWSPYPAITLHRQGLVPTDREYIRRAGGRWVAYCAPRPGATGLTATFGNVADDLAAPGRDHRPASSREVADGRLDGDDAPWVEVDLGLHDPGVYDYSSVPAGDGIGNNTAASASIYPQVWVGPIEGQPAPDVFGVVYRSVDRRGWGFGSISRGGARIDPSTGASLYNFHPDAIESIASAYAPDVYVVMYGANDANGAVATTPEGFRAGAELIVDQVAAHDPQAITVIFNSPDFNVTRDSVEGRRKLNEYTAEAVSIAQDRPGVVFLNLARVLAERHQWFVDDDSLPLAPQVDAMLSDTVHWTAQGSLAVAVAQVDLLWAVGEPVSVGP